MMSPWERPIHYGSHTGANDRMTFKLNQGLVTIVREKRTEKIFFSKQIYTIQA